jgi:hypothetical protein
MRRLLSLVLLAASCLAQTPSAQTGESRLLFGQIDEIMKGLGEITGWKVKRKVPADYITRDQLQQYVQKRIRETVKPEELRIESLTLKLFGLVPEDFDLEKATVDLVTEQAAAFYDYNRKRLFITETSATFIEQRIVLVHELAHALADQQHSLAKYIRKGGASDDDAAAREAVMEGQATWLMWAYSSKLNGGEARPSEIILDTMRAAGATGSTQFPVFERAPLYLRESLVFPYNQGLLFQEAVYGRLGKGAFSEVFRRAPRTTAQILHPAAYFARPEPVRLRVMEPPEHKKYRTLVQGSIGEFDYRILLEQYVSRGEADRIAPDWRGGAFRVYETKKGKRPLLTCVSEWASEAAAREWFRAYKRVLEGKSKEIRFGRVTPVAMTGRNERGRFDVRLEGKQVSSIEGLPESTVN